MTTMKAVRMHDYGGREVLAYDDVPVPEPGPGEVLVRVRAASVNTADWWMREGWMRQWVDLPLPITLGRDMAGDVVAVGAGVTDFQVGDAVFGAVNFGRGTHAEYVAAPASELAPMPRGLDYTAAAAVPHAAQAAWAGLIESGGLEPGQTVLIHGAAGGVGGYAVQLAKQRGAHVIATASAANHDYVRDLGADEVIDYTATPFETAAHDVDLVLDTVGGDVQERSWAVLKPGGILVSLVSPPSEDAAAAHQARGAMAAGYPSGARLRQIADLVEAGQLRPTVGMVLPLTAAPQAHAQVETRHTRGKIIFRVSDD